MADRIALQKLGFAFAPAQKITPLKRENRDSDKRRFERQLTEENEKNPEDTIHLDADVQDMAGGDGGPKDRSLGEDAEKRGPDKGGRVDGTAPPGSVVDIHV
ncbi:MAG: hypothetical protein R6X27_04755 [Candidatus Desulfacyla sp.]